MDNAPAGTISEAMEHDTDIAVVGGGLTGPVLALALASAGFRVTVVDAQPAAVRADAGFDGRAYALAHASMRMLRALGLWAGIQPDTQPILRIVASDGLAGQGAAPWFLHFDAAEIEEGPMGWICEDRFLRGALLAAMEAEPRIETVSGAKVIDQTPDAAGITLTLAGGQRLRARLVAGCDGRGSGTAARAGIRRIGWGYGQTALVCAVAHERPHAGTAHQFFMPAGPLAILPLPGDRSSIVWSEDADLAAAILKMDDADFLQVLRPRFGDFRGAIRPEGKRFAYPLGLSLAHEFIAERVVLVGDAAHGLHPIAGQGFNLGMRDVAALAEVLAEAARRGEDIAAAPVLARYQQWRRFDTVAMAVATDGFNRLFSNDSTILRGLRDAGMAAVSAMPGLRRRFIREAAGLTGALPRLLQGRPV